MQHPDLFDQQTDDQTEQCTGIDLTGGMPDDFFQRFFGERFPVEQFPQDLVDPLGMEP